MSLRGTAHSSAETGGQPDGGGKPVATALRLIAVQSTLASVALHLLWGLPRAVIYFRTGTIADPRPYLFVVSGVALLAAVTALYFDAKHPTPTQIYAFCAGVLALYVVGYLWWHLGGHGGLIPGVKGYGHPDLSNLGVLFSDAHLYRPLDLASMVVDSTGLICFIGLLTLDR